MIFFDIEPMGKPRMTQKDKWAKRDVVERYFSFKDNLNYKAKAQQFKIGTVIDLLFIISMPKSWSDKKRKEMNGRCHQQKPDWDNLAKAFCDALTGNDATIWHGSAKKYWGESGAVLVLRNDVRSDRFYFNKNSFIPQNAYRA